MIAVAFSGWAQPQNESSPAGQNSSDLVIMSGMRSLVPSLLALGWDDFFLASRNDIHLSASQIQDLIALRLDFQLAQQALEERLTGAKLALYETLNRDQVSMRDVEARAREVCRINTDMVALRFRSLLRAINVLTHEQHQLLASLVNLKKTPRSPPFAPQSFAPGGEGLPLLSGERLQLVQYRDAEPKPRPPNELNRECQLQPSISAKALLSYEQGEEAPRRLERLARQLQREAREKPELNMRTLRGLVAQMKPEFALMQHTVQTLSPLLNRTMADDSEAAQLIHSLQLSEIADHLAGLQAQLASPAVAPLVTKHAAALKESAKLWRKAFRRVGDVLCLTPWPISHERSNNRSLARPSAQAFSETIRTSQKSGGAND